MKNYYSPLPCESSRVAQQKETLFYVLFLNVPHGTIDPVVLRFGSEAVNTINYF